MKKGTKQLIAALLPLGVAGVWLPQILPQGSGASQTTDASTGASTDESNGSAFESGWIEADSEGSAQGLGSMQSVDVIRMGAGETMDQIERLEQVLASAQLFRAPTPAQQSRIVETLEAALAQSEAGSNLLLAAALDTASVGDSDMGLVPAARDQAGLGRPRRELRAWADASRVGGILTTQTGARCLFEGRILGVGDHIAWLAGSDLPVLVKAITQDAVIVSHAGAHARVALGPFSKARLSTGVASLAPSSGNQSPLDIPVELPAALPSGEELRAGPGADASADLPGEEENL